MASQEIPRPRNGAAGASADDPPGARPRLRGVLHQYAFLVSLVAGVALVVTAPAARARLPAAVYAVTLAGLFGVSALYHRVTWSADTRRWIRRLDHSMIFLLIAGTYTPFAALVLGKQLGTVVLVVVWVAALGGIGFNLAWIDAPRWVPAVIAVALGWVSLPAIPDLVRATGLGPLVLLVAGGVAYSVGAVVYSVKRPDPFPAVFGYHEIFHALVIAAAVLHFAAVAIYALPA